MQFHVCIAVLVDMHSLPCSAIRESVDHCYGNNVITPAVVQCLCESKKRPVKTSHKQALIVTVENQTVSHFIFLHKQRSYSENVDRLSFCAADLKFSKETRIFVIL